MADIFDFDDDKKRKTTKKVKEILDEAKPKKTRRKIAKRTGNVIYVNGDGVAVGQISGGDIHNHINKKEIVRPKVIRGPEYISSSCARKIQNRIKTLVDIGLAAGNGDAGKLYAMWHAKLKKYFDVVSYLEIPAHHEKSAIDWLQKQKVLLRPTIRRASNDTWRQEHYKGIWARANELGMSRADVYLLVNERLGKNIVSLKNLGERDLKHLYNIIFKIPR